MTAVIRPRDATFLASAICLALAGLAAAGAAVFAMRAGPIRDNVEAGTACVAACTLRWDGEWVTKGTDGTAICHAVNALGYGLVVDGQPGGIAAGPIDGPDAASRICEALSASIAWNGNWRTIRQGEMSECDCTGGIALPWRPNAGTGASE